MDVYQFRRLREPEPDFGSRIPKRAENVCVCEEAPKSQRPRLLVRG